MPDTLSAFTVKLDTIEVTCIADPSQPDADLDPRFDAEYRTLDATESLSRDDIPLHLRRLDRGFGFMKRRDEGDEGGYAWGEDVLTWLGNGVIPSGRRTAVGVGLGLSPTPTPVTDSVLFNGDLYAICSIKHGLKWANANPTNVPSFSPPLNFAGDATASFRVNYLPKAITTFWTYLDGAGAYLAGGTKTPCVIISASTAGGATRMYQYTTTWGWREGAADLGYRADSMAVVWWTGSDGAGAYRLVIQADDGTFRHCIQGSDPLTGASYVTPIEVAEPGYVANKVIGAGGHAYAKTTGGIVDFNELRTWPVTPYWKESATYTLGNAALIYDDHLYAARGLGLDRFSVRLDEGVQQRLPGECGPGAFMQDGHPITGYVTALATHAGWLLAAVYNPATQTSYIMRGKDRRILGLDVPCPLVWHGAEQVLSGTNSVVNHMRVTPDAVSGYASPTSRLWMFTSDGTSGNLYHAPVPDGAGPISLLLSGGTFSFNSTGRLYLTEQNWDDGTATAALRRIDSRGEKVSASRTIEVKTRTGQPPETITTQATWTSQGTATADSAELTPPAATAGKGIAFQVVLTSPSPYTAAPIFVELSPRAKVIRETIQAVTLYILLERGAETRIGSRDLRKVSTLAGQIAGLQDVGEFPYRDEEGVTWRAMLRQNLRVMRQRVEGDWRSVLRVEVSLIAAVP